MPFYPPLIYLSAFGSGASAGSWLTNDRTPRLIADIGGYPAADVIGFGEDGVYVALSSDNGFGLSLSMPTLVLTAFGASAAVGGWTSDDQFPRRMGDVNGDGWADIVGFGWHGTYVALATGNGSFSAVTHATTTFGVAASSGGWESDDRNPRMLGDVNGDGRDDIVGFGNDGILVSLAAANGTFLPSILASTAFGASASAGGWSSNDRYPRMLADLNFDGRADVVGFGEAGVYVSYATTDGTFAAPFLASSQFGAHAAAGGWSSNDLYPRMLGSFDIDRIPDIIGFGNDGVFIARGNGDGTFAPAVLEMADFGLTAAGGGWTSNDVAPRRVADMDFDGFDDIIGMNGAGVSVAHSIIDYWGYW